MIPYLDLHAVNAPYAEALKTALSGVVDSGWYLFGSQVSSFEREWARYCGLSDAHADAVTDAGDGGEACKSCVACANGLDALRLVLRAWIEMGRLRRGDEVIVPANTYIASILAVSDNGLVPVPVEPDAESWLLDPARVEASITARTRALLPVHLYGQLCDMDALMQIADAHGLLVLEDCAQSHGVSPRYRGTAQAWSFYPGKNLGALGDAGAVTSSDAELIETIRRIAFYGSSRKYVHIYKGLNSRMDELQAAVLRLKLKDLDRCNACRREMALRYSSEIVSPLVTLPVAKGPHVYHIYPILSPQRDALQQYLADLGIRTQIHYPIPPHRQQAYSEWRHLSFPITERIASQELSLPCNQSLSPQDVTSVIDALNAFRGE